MPENLRFAYSSFQKGRAVNAKGKAPVRPGNEELPAELDFFRHARGASSKRKIHESDDEGADQTGQRKTKRRLDEDEDGNDPEETVPQVPRQRVTAKGSNVPEPLGSFGLLKDRYRIGSHLLSNLAQNSFSHPTGIQSYGIPILLEVCLLIPESSNPSFIVVFSRETSLRSLPPELGKPCRTSFLSCQLCEHLLQVIKAMHLVPGPSLSHPRVSLLTRYTTNASSWHRDASGGLFYLTRLMRILWRTRVPGIL
jgi:hypothetical protein